MNEFICTGNVEIPNQYVSNVFVKKMSDIIVNKSETYVGDIYPKYVSYNGIALKEFCVINARTKDDFDEIPTKYVEIGDLEEGKLSLGKKKNKTTKFCKKGDILIGSLCPTKKHILISDGEYMLSTAIHVLSGFKDDDQRDLGFEELRNSLSLLQMNVLLDGFKITYAKINDTNLINNVKILIN